MRNQPVPASRAPSPSSTRGGGGGDVGRVVGSVAANVIERMVLSMASAIGHRLVDAWMGPRTIQIKSTEVAAPTMIDAGTADDPCNIHAKALEDCLNRYKSDISKCQFYMNMLSECQRKSGSVTRVTLASASSNLSKINSKC